ncbi:MAG: CPBP family intramembrane metalloprotease [Bryobacteraceae bacterium]|nr:CPBP family intramembrane metalloprotease [Bryobacteraceae bacterium]MCX7603402.1 CPBP family intramembrane metalloprotease [Bryobacteraceae bacterium]
MGAVEAGAAQRVTVTGLLIRAGLFLLFVRVGGWLFGGLLYALFESLLVAAAVGLFLAAAGATAVVVRVFERGRLEDVGLGWWPHGGRNLLAGTLAGVAAGLGAVLLPAAFGLAEIVRAPEPELAFSTGKFLFVTALFWFGAAGEELMFRGYAFQILLRRFGPAWTLAPFAVLFALAHVGNPHANWAGLAVTGLWGLVLGYAFHTGGDLWMPIGIHFGWNWALPLLGVKVSGFTMGLTGLAVRWKAGPIWSGGEYGIEGGLPGAAAAAALGIWLWKRKRQPQTAASVSS